ncbi:NYN domain-containing protein [Corynebacterium propinquum]
MSHQSMQLPLRQITTAILVDGGYYRRRAKRLFGEKTPEDRAYELLEYCRRHIRKSQSGLYRIFYYDCPPSERVVYHPLTMRQVNLSKSEQFTWTRRFHLELVTKRKVALRRGEELSTQGTYTLKDKPLKKLCRGDLQVNDLKEDDFMLEITQKGVDMRIGLDIASLAEKNLVNQIVMISGDSDFVPAAKHARRSGIDFILDPMWGNISRSLGEHIDGRRECVQQVPLNKQDPLHIWSQKDMQVEEDEEEL